MLVDAHIAALPQLLADLSALPAVPLYVLADLSAAHATPYAALHAAPGSATHPALRPAPGTSPDTAPSNSTFGFANAAADVEPLVPGPLHVLADVQIAALPQLLADVTVPALHKPQDDVTAMACLALRLLTDLSAAARCCTHCVPSRTSCPSCPGLPMIASWLLS